jgi:ribonuclease VapC
MIVDASAILAILLKEAEGPAFLRKIAAHAAPRMSVVNWLEAAIRVDRKHSLIASGGFDDLIEAAGIEMVPADEEQARIARRAFLDYGKGSGHPARLNLGDAFAYALARQTGEPLLFKGDDFGHTDIPAA